MTLEQLLSKYGRYLTLAPRRKDYCSLGIRHPAAPLLCFCIWRYGRKFASQPKDTRDKLTNYMIAPKNPRGETWEWEEKQRKREMRGWKKYEERLAKELQGSSA